MDEIRNKIKESGLINLDLAEFKPDMSRLINFDLADQLWQGLVLKEKDFRSFISNNDWTQYENKYVYVHCSADAIVPTWAFMLVSSQLLNVASVHVVGSQIDLEKELIKNNISEFDTSSLIDERIIIKGCADISCPEFAMTELLKKLQPISKSIMYGEPCSTVPIYKAKR